MENPANNEPQGPTHPEDQSPTPKGKGTFEPEYGKVYEGHILPKKGNGPEADKSAFKVSINGFELEIRIHPALHTLMPPQARTERQSLENQLKEGKGNRDPIVLWRDSDTGLIYVLDGENRLAMLTAL